MLEADAAEDQAMISKAFNPALPRSKARNREVIARSLPANAGQVREESIDNNNNKYIPSVLLALCVEFLSPFFHPPFRHQKTLAAAPAADYDPIEHLNAIFSNPSTLSSVTSVSEALQQHQDDLDDDIAELVAAQSGSDAESVHRIQVAKADLAEMFLKIENVRERAIQTEQAITEMTADIKRLDGTKRNLTVSMTALKRLQMLTTAYEQLRGLIKSRQYRECAQLLQAVIQLMAHFKSYRSIDQIATLSRNVAELQRELLEQICEVFEITFAKGEVAQRRAVLAEACHVIDALGDNARSRLITWYCNTQLREYRQVFRGNEEAGSLDNVTRRYSWFRRMLKTYDDEHAALFPPYWRVSEMLANAFCESTRDDFKGILSRSMRKTDGQSLDVNLLLSCLQETMDFEQGLERRFSDESRTSADTMSSRDERAHVFGRSISEAFEPYLSLWVDSQDKQLSMMIPKYRQQPPQTPDEEFSSQSVIASSVDLFHFYRLTLGQCAKLSTGSKLLDLSKTFARYLDEYAEQVLLNYLRDRPGVPLPLEDTILVLNTADYCHTTCAQLEEKIKGRIDEDLKPKVDLLSQADAFMGIASAAIRALVRKVEQDCDQSWREMRNTPWSKLEAVGDQSSYVAELLKHVKSRAAEILRLISKQQYARAFCDNLVELLANSYLMSIVQSKPVSETGAEQMLLDTYVLKKGFEELIVLNAEPGVAAPPSYLKRVHQSMTKLDPLLKTLQVRSSPAEGLVQAYLIHIGDRSDNNFRKILDLKGVRKQDQAHLVELFHAHRAAQDNLVQNSPLLTPLNLQSSNVGGGISSLGPTGSSLSPQTLQGRFDASSFGSVIMSAARDGVDRLGTPALGATSNQASGAISPAPSLANAGETNAAANLNDNLRNIGKFFRRDMTGFGGRFGGNKSVDEGAR
ncbi:MAG: Vacuolar protein sorting-associated protein 53 [Sclerophora amabilis]|nr:MAG: Vacuolar protein sorting-associated protein 53 [Sclerophora amabilis]